MLRFLAFATVICLASGQETSENGLYTPPKPFTSKDIMRDRVVYLINLLAIPKDVESRARKADSNSLEEFERPKEFNTLLLLTPVQVADDDVQPQVQSEPVEAEPIYVKKLDEIKEEIMTADESKQENLKQDAELPVLNRQRRHLKKLFGGGYGGGGYGGGGYGGGGYGGGGYSGGYGVEKTIVIVPVSSGHGGGGYGGHGGGHGGHGGGLANGGGGGYGGGFGGGFGGGYGGGGGGGYGGGNQGGYGGGNQGGYGGGNQGGYGGHSGGGCPGGCGGNDYNQGGGGGGGGGSYSQATATATATASASANSGSGGYGYGKR